MPGPVGMILKEVEKVGLRAFCELRSLVARSLSSFKKKKKKRHLIFFPPSLSNGWDIVFTFFMESLNNLG